MITININVEEIKDTAIFAALTVMAYLIRFVGCTILFTNFLIDKTAETIAIFIVMGYKFIESRWAMKGQYLLLGACEDRNNETR